jgi:hypothetical protein
MQRSRIAKDDLQPTIEGFTPVVLPVLATSTTLLSMLFLRKLERVLYSRS